MAELKYQPISHDHKTFLKNALKREGFRRAYEDLEEEYILVREMLAARSTSGLTQEAVAKSMRTTKSAVSRLESAGKHAPSLSTLRKYAQAVGCRLEIKLVRNSSSNRPTRGARRLRAERARRSPLDIPSIQAAISTEELVKTVRKESGQARGWRRHVSR